jgi:hypothetical protein
MVGDLYRKPNDCASYVIHFKFLTFEYETYGAHNRDGGINILCKRTKETMHDPMKMMTFHVA